MADTTSPLAQIRYHISLEQYLDFNFSVAEQNYKAQRRKSTIMGAIEIVVGVLFAVSLLMTEETKRQQMELRCMSTVLKRMTSLKPETR